MRALIAALILSIAGFGIAAAESLDVSWTHPDQREDGSALLLEEIKGYALWWGKCGEPQTEIVLPRVESHSIPLQGDGYGSWCIDAQTIDINDIRSARVSVSRTIIAPPKPPGLFTVATVVWEMKLHPTQGLVAGRVVGWVPTGAQCYADQYGRPFVEPDLYGIHRSFVAFTKEPKSDLLVAKCAAAAGQG